MIDVKEILIPTDFSECSSRAVDYGVALAAKFGARVHLFHSLELHSTATPAFGAGLALTSFERESQTMVNEKLNQAVTELQGSGVETLLATAPGNPSNEIVRYATDNNIDMIVIGTHGRTGLSRTILGSVAEAVVRTSPCLVTTVHPNVKLPIGIEKKCELAS